MAAGVAHLAVAEAGRRAVRVQLAGAAAAHQAAARARAGRAPRRRRARARALRRRARPRAPRRHRRLQRLHLGASRSASPDPDMFDSVVSPPRAHSLLFRVPPLGSSVEVVFDFEPRSARRGPDTYVCPLPGGDASGPRRAAVRHSGDVAPPPREPTRRVYLISVFT